MPDSRLSSKTFQSLSLSLPFFFFSFFSVLSRSLNLISWIYKPTHLHCCLSSRAYEPHASFAILALSKPCNCLVRAKELIINSVAAANRRYTRTLETFAETPARHSSLAVFVSDDGVFEFCCKEERRCEL
ncbi:unnamed protein product [Camellia sinensis]